MWTICVYRLEDSFAVFIYWEMDILDDWEQGFICRVVLLTQECRRTFGCNRYSSSRLSKE
jgi:hypothetical protein